MEGIFLKICGMERIIDLSLRMECQMMEGIGRNEVRVTLSRMKKGETTEMDGIPEDVWMCFWEKKGLTCYQSDATCIRAGEHINGVVWRDSLIVYIYKEE